MESIGSDLETMKRVPLADAHVAALSEIGEQRWYAKGEMIARVGERMDRFIYLIEGEVEIVDPYSGDRLLDAVLGPTQFLGDIGLLHASAHFLGARAVSDTRTLEASREQMLELMGRMPELSDHIITVFAARRRRQFELKSSSIKLIGADRDPAVQCVEAFLSRNRIPFQSYDLDGAGAGIQRPMNVIVQTGCIFPRTGCGTRPGAYQKHSMSI